MRDHGITPVSVVENEGRITTNDETWRMSDIIGAADSRYLFETLFEPYARYTRGITDKIDLVVARGGKPLRPLEIKLTVIPDSTTVNETQHKWSAEIVVRPVSSAYAMMNVAANISKDTTTLQKVLAVLRPGYNSVDDWNNTAEIAQRSDQLRNTLGEALQIVVQSGLQRPFLVQPLWRTVGQSFELEERCFDVFVWSDVAVMRIPVDLSYASVSVTRSVREVARHVRALYDVLSQGDYSYDGIYKGMSLGHQTDKSFSLNGKKSIDYLRHARLKKPCLPRGVLTDLILGGGERELKPERRFDAAVSAFMINRRDRH